MSIKTQTETSRTKNEVLQELQDKIEILEAQVEIGLGATNLKFYKRLEACIEGTE